MCGGASSDEITLRTTLKKDTPSLPVPLGKVRRRLNEEQAFGGGIIDRTVVREEEEVNDREMMNLAGSVEKVSLCILYSTII